MSNNKHSRRTFLQALGLSGMALPLLEADLKAAEAGAASRRFLTIVWPNGVTNDFWPTTAGVNFELTEPLSPLKDHRKDIIIVDGISNQAMMSQAGAGSFGGHASLPYLLTGADCHLVNGGAVGNSMSLDQVIADQIKQRAATPQHSLVMGVDNREESKADQKYISFRGKAVGGQPTAVPVQDDVHKTYQQLFSAKPDGTVDPAAAARLMRARARRKSLLDFVGRDLERFGARLGSESKMKVERHLTTIREIETDLDAIPTTGGGGIAGAGKPDPTINSYAKDNYHRILKAQIDLAVAAFATGQTRVATILASNGHNNTWVFGWLGGDFGQAGDGSFNRLRSHHEMAHRGGVGGTGEHGQRKNTVDKWFISQLAYTMAKMKETQEGAGTLLDNSVVLFANNMGNGASHVNTRLPWILGGSCGKAFRTGQLLRTGNRPHNGVLVAIAKAMGHDVPWFGKDSYGGALPGLLA